jgi:hypothetical protein
VRRLSRSPPETDKREVEPLPETPAHTPLGCGDGVWWVAWVVPMKLGTVSRPMSTGRIVVKESKIEHCIVYICQYSAFTRRHTTLKPIRRRNE